MKINLRDTEVRRGTFRFQATGTFSEGIHLVRGPVGSGKTTLAFLIAGLLPPDRGEVQKEGILRTGLLMQFPEYQVTARTIAEEVESYGAPVEPVLREMNLWDRRQADPLTISRGELKRLLLNSLLHTVPDLLLLDEPFGGMDCRERGKMIDKISGSGARIIILFSHDQGKQPCLDHLWEILDGRLIVRGAGSEGFSERALPLSDRSENGRERSLIPSDASGRSRRET
jgi:energy-coupling factor transport system ATP-binding protein